MSARAQEDSGGDLFGDLLLLGLFAGVGYGAYLFIEHFNLMGAATSPTSPPGLPPPTDQSPYYTPPAQDPAPPGYATPPHIIMQVPAPGAETIQPGAFNVSPAGEAFTKRFEGWRPMRYRDGPGYAIGWGHFIRPTDHFPPTITPAFGNQLFDTDMSAVESAMNTYIHVPLSQSQVDAIADWIYNRGAGIFRTSALLQDLNAGDYAAAAAALGDTTGVVLPGIKTRRAAEQQLFNQTGIA